MFCQKAYVELKVKGTLDIPKEEGSEKIDVGNGTLN